MIKSLHRYAHVVRRQLVLRRGLHGDAHLAVAEHRKQQSTQHCRCRDDGHLLDVEHQLTQFPDLVLVGHGQSVGVGANIGDHGDQAARHVADANGQHDDGKLGLTQNRADHQALEAETKHRHGSNRTENGQPEWKAQQRHQRQTAKSAQHHQFALHKAHRFGGLVDQHKAQRDQAIDTALRHSADEQLQKLHFVSIIIFTKRLLGINTVLGAGQTRTLVIPILC